MLSWHFCRPVAVVTGVAETCGCTASNFRAVIPWPTILTILSIDSATGIAEGAQRAGCGVVGACDTVTEKM